MELELELELEQPTDLIIKKEDDEEQEVFTSFKFGSLLDFLF